MDSSRQVSDVSNTCGVGEFDGCEGRIRPFLDDTLDGVSESIMLQKLRSARAGGKPNKGKFRRCHHTHQLFLHVVIGPDNKVSHVERRHSHAAPGLGDRVCFVVGNEDGNRSFLRFFEK